MKALNDTFHLAPYLGQLDKSDFTIFPPQILRQRVKYTLYCKAEMDSNFYAQYYNMIGLLAKIIRTSKNFKNVLRYFGKVWLKSNLCILWIDWLIALYLFTPLTCNASFLIVKHSCIREELSDVNRSLCKNIFLVSSRLCTSPLVRALPQLTLPPSPTTPSPTTPSTAPACAH